MPDAGERHFAQELRSVNLGASYEMSEWKQTQQKQSMAYGHQSTKTIKEQRADLPIYKLKRELCQAIADNQV